MYFPFQTQSAFELTDIGWNIYKSREKKDLIRNTRTKTVDAYKIKYTFGLTHSFNYTKVVIKRNEYNTHFGNQNRT